MKFIDWQQSFSVNVKQFDNDHKKLVHLINTLHDAMQSGEAFNMLNSIINELTNYALMHFSNEEKMMQLYQYPYFVSHKQEHESFQLQIQNFQSKFKGTNTRVPISSITISLMNFLKEWLTNHILESDRKYGKYFNSKGLY